MKIFFANLHWQPFSPVYLGADRETSVSAQRSPGNKEQPIAREARISQPITFLPSEIGGKKVGGCVRKLLSARELNTTLHDQPESQSSPLKQVLGGLFSFH